MKIENRINCLLQDPEIYNVYYDEKYNTTLNTLNKLKENNAPESRLVHLQIKLAEMAGKRAVTVGKLNKLPDEVLITYWTTINNYVKTCDESMDHYSDFVNYITKIEPICFKL